MQTDASLSAQIDEMTGSRSKGDTPATKLSVLVKDGLRRISAKDLTSTPSLLVGVDFIGGPGALQGVVGPCIFNVFPQRHVGGGSVRYLQQRQVAAAVPAAEVAPGAAKAGGDMDGRERGCRHPGLRAHLAGRGQQHPAGHRLAARGSPQVLRGTAATARCFELRDLRRGLDIRTYVRYG